MSNIPMKTLTAYGPKHEKLTFEIVDPGAVHFNEPQTMTPEQQAQARDNIGFESAVLDVLVSFGVAPVLLDADGAVLCDSDAIPVND